VASRTERQMSRSGAILRRSPITMTAILLDWKKWLISSFRQWPMPPHARRKQPLPPRQTRFRPQNSCPGMECRCQSFGYSDDTLAKTSASDLLNECGAAFESAISTDNKQDVNAKLFKPVNHFSGVLRTARPSWHRTTEGLNRGDGF
jgi:hypothetical protein